MTRDTDLTREELIARLNATYVSDENGPLCHEAARALLASQDEVARLTGDRDTARKIADHDKALWLAAEARADALAERVRVLQAYGPPEFYVTRTAQHEASVARAKAETEEWKRKAQEANKRALSDDATIRSLRKQIATLKETNP